MKTVSIQQFVKLRTELTEEQARLQARLRDINQALGEMSLPSSSPVVGGAESAPARRGRRASDSGESLREHVIAVLQSGAMTKEEVLSAVQSRGYKFSTKNPLNSLGVILYGKRPKLNRADGRFSLGNGVSTTTTAGGGRGGRRTMSAAGRARIAAAQKARWAKQRGGPVAKAASNGATAKPKRKMSPAARKAIAESARKRWAAAKAAGKSTL